MNDRNPWAPSPKGPPGHELVRPVRGVRAWARDAAAGHGHQRDDLVGERITMAEQGSEIVLVERPVVQPLDRSDEEQTLGDGSTVRPDDVYLDVIAPCPISADGGGGRQIVIGKQTGQGIADQWFDGAPMSLTEVSAASCRLSRHDAAS